MNRRTFIAGGAALGALAVSGATVPAVWESLHVPSLRFFAETLPASARMPLSDARRREVSALRRALVTASGTTVTVDRVTRAAVATSTAGQQARIDQVWDVAELGDGSFVVATRTQGILRVGADFGVLEVLVPHDFRRTITRVAASRDQWVAYTPSEHRFLSSHASLWRSPDSLKLQAVTDILGLDDGRFVIADAAGAAVVITDGRTHDTLAELRDRHQDPVAPLGLMRDSDGVIWVRSSQPVASRFWGLA